MPNKSTDRRTVGSQHRLVRCPSATRRMPLPRDGSLQRRVLDHIDHARVCSNRDLAKWIERNIYYVGQAATALYKKGLIGKEGPGVWATKTNW